MRSKLVQFEDFMKPIQHEDGKDDRSNRSLGASRSNEQRQGRLERERELSGLVCVAARLISTMSPVEVESTIPPTSSPITQEEERVWSEETLNGEPFWHMSLMTDSSDLLCSVLKADRESDSTDPVDSAAEEDKSRYVRVELIFTQLALTSH